MADNWKKLIVALDFDDKKLINKVVKTLSPKGVKFKIGLQAFTKYGPELLKPLIKQKADIFLDLKLHDIPNTMKSAAAVIAGMGCWAFTVHTKAGIEALKEVRAQVLLTSKQKKLRCPLILGVTELTSSNAGLEDVLKLAKLAADARIDGVIASAKEASAIKRKYGNKLKVITPGIRNPNDDIGDQKRVMTAKNAFAAGADFIVVGRPIISKKDYLKAAIEVLKY
jgi:orotidine-5'-phosphate decarboxylase